MATEHAKTNTSYIFRRRTSSTIYLKIYRNVGGILQLELWFLTATGKLLKVE
jgi:ABC-type amino acid transport system permease subunit